MSGPSAAGGIGPDPGLQRARFFMERRRFAQAEAELRRALAADPENAVLHANLALCVSVDPARLDEAYDVALRATTKDPIHPLTWFAVSRVDELRGNFSRAEEAAKIALGCRPDLSSLHGHLANLVLTQGRTAEALAGVERALDLEPDSVDAHLLHGRILWRLGRRAEAEAAYARALASDPESAAAHALAGEAALHRGDAGAALGHYREALRLDPAITAARDGMMEALRARNPLYRAMLRVSLRLPGDLPPELKWGAIGIGVAAVCFLWLAADGMGLPAWTAIPPQAAVVGAVLLAWTARPLANLPLCFDPLGAASLTRAERTEASVVGALLAGAAALAVAALAGGGDFFGFASVLAALYTIPVRAAARARPGWPRTVSIAYAAAVLAPIGAFLSLQLRDMDGASLWFGLSIGGLCWSDLLVNLLTGSGAPRPGPRPSTG